MTDRATVQQAMDENSASLSGKPNVVGLGIQRVGKDHVLAVYVSEKIDRDALPPGAKLPETLSVKREGVLKQVDVKIIEQGSNFNLE